MNPIPDIDAIAIVKTLLATAVNDRPPGELPAMTEEEWFYVLGICAVQNIHSFVYDYLPSVVPASVHYKWKELADNNAARNMLVTKVVETQEIAWRRHGLDYCLLKGTGVSELYVHPEHRGCGDIDWYFADERSWIIAKDLALENCDTALKKDSDGDFNYTFKEVVIEHHRDWSHLSSRKLRQLLGRPAVINGRLSAEDTLLVLETHILHHLAYCGMGLKQIADLAVAFIRLDGRYDKKAFAARMERVGLKKWSMLLHSVLVELTGIQADLLPISPVSSGKDTELLVSLLFSDGCIPTGREFSLRLLAIRFGLMVKVSGKECFARYLHLLGGRISLLLEK